jgi:hypothetical protein
MMTGDIEDGAYPRLLIGTRLLNGCIMTMNFIDNTLTIDKPLPQ